MGMGVMRQGPWMYQKDGSTSGVYREFSVSIESREGWSFCLRSRLPL